MTQTKRERRLRPATDHATNQVSAPAAIESATKNLQCGGCERLGCRGNALGCGGRRAVEIAPALPRKARSVRIRQCVREQFRQRCPAVAPAEFPIMVARRDVEIGVDKFNRLIDALGCEDAAGKRIKKTLRDLKADRLRNERRIDGLGRLPDGALRQTRAHQTFDSTR